MNKECLISKKILEKEYLLELKPMSQIAKEHNIAVGTVFNYMKIYRNKVKT